MEYIIHIVTQYLPNNMDMRLVCKDWYKMLRQNDIDVVRTVWKVSYPDVKYTTSLVRCILLGCIQNGDSTSIRCILSGISRPIRGINWESMIKSISSDNVALPIIEYVQNVHKMRASIIYNVIGICIERGYTNTLKQVLLQYRYTLYFAFSYVRSVHPAVSQLCTDMGIDISHYQYYISDAQRTNSPEDPYITLVMEAVRRDNKSLVISILSKRSTEIINSHYCTDIEVLIGIYDKSLLHYFQK